MGKVINKFYYLLFKKHFLYFLMIWGSDLENLFSQHRSLLVMLQEDKSYLRLIIHCFIFKNKQKNPLLAKFADLFCDDK